MTLHSSKGGQFILREARILSSSSEDGAEGVGDVVMMTVKASDIGGHLGADAGGISATRGDGT